MTGGFIAILDSVKCSQTLKQAEAARDSKQSPMVQRNSSFATSHEVWKYICELGISKVTLPLPRPLYDITVRL